MRHPIRWVIVFAVLFGLSLGWLQWWKFEQFGYNGLDLGIYTQTVWSLAHGHGFASSIHDPSYLGDHFETALIPIAGLYRLWPSPLLLLWIQTLALALSAIPLFWLAKKYLPAKGAVLAAGLWLAHPFLYNPAMYEFHGMTLTLPFFLLAILAYQEKRWRWWLAWLAALCLMREDLPLVALSWVVLAIIDRVPWRWWLSVAVLAIGWFIASHLMIAHANALGQYKYTAFVSWLGSSPLEMITYPFRHPLLFLGHIFGPKNWGTALGLAVGFGLVPLVRIRALIPAGLTFIQTIVIGSSPNSVLHLHYVIPFLPFLAWAAFQAVADARQGKLWPERNQEFVRLVVYVVVIVGPLYLHLLYGPGELPWRRTGFAEPTPARDLKAALAVVQPIDRVITTFNTLPNLGNREHVYSLNYIYLGRRQYTEIAYQPPTPIDVAIIDWRELYDYQFLYRETLFEGRTGEQRILDLLKDNGLKPAVWSGSVIAYTKTGQLDAPLTTSQPGTSSATLQPVNDVALTTPDGIEITIDWGMSATPEKPVSIQFVLQDVAGNKITASRLLGEGGTPSTNWTPDKKWRTVYRVSVPTEFIPATIDYSWVELSGRYHLDRLRSFHRIVSDVTTLGQDSMPVQPSS